jgi:hypothetical protein
LSFKRTYSELIEFDTLEKRFDYLRIGGKVGFATLGFERWLNQSFYTSAEWRRIRHVVIARDLGNDLGVEGWPVMNRITVHHMNPMDKDDLKRGNPEILDPEFLISVSHGTHNAIHYGDRSLLPQPFVERRPGDTTPWKR